MNNNSTAAYFQDVRCEDFLEAKAPTHVTNSILHTLMIASFMALSIFTVVDNTVVFLALTLGRGRPSNLTLSMVMTLSLICADITLAVCVEPFVIYEYIGESWRLRNTLCMAYQSVDIMLSSSSIFHLAALAFERYLAVCRPMFHRRQKNSFAGWICVSCWLLAAFTTSVPLMGGFQMQSTEVDDDSKNNCLQDQQEDDTCKNLFSPHNQFISMVLSIVFPIFLTIGFHVRTFIQVYTKRYTHTKPGVLKTLTSLDTGRPNHISLKKGLRYNCCQNLENSDERGDGETTVYSLQQAGKPESLRLPLTSSSPLCSSTGHRAEVDPCADPRWRSVVAEDIQSRVKEAQDLKFSTHEYQAKRIPLFHPKRHCRSLDCSWTDQPVSEQLGVRVPRKIQFTTTNTKGFVSRTLSVTDAKMLLQLLDAVPISRSIKQKRSPSKMDMDGLLSGNIDMMYISLLLKSHGATSRSTTAVPTQEERCPTIASANDSVSKNLDLTDTLLPLKPFNATSRSDVSISKTSASLQQVTGLTTTNKNDAISRNLNPVHSFLLEKSSSADSRYHYSASSISASIQQLSDHAIISVDNLKSPDVLVSRDSNLSDTAAMPTKFYRMPLTSTTSTSVHQETESAIIRPDHSMFTLLSQKDASLSLTPSKAIFAPTSTPQETDLDHITDRKNTATGAKFTHVTPTMVQKKFKRWDRATKTILCLLLSFLLCWLPFFIVWVVMNFGKVTLPTDATTFAYRLGYLNSMLNPILCYCFNMTIRCAVRKFLHLKNNDRSVISMDQTCKQVKDPN